MFLGYLLLMAVVQRAMRRHPESFERAIAQISGPSGDLSGNAFFVATQYALRGSYAEEFRGTLLERFRLLVLIGFAAMAGGSALCLITLVLAMRGRLGA